MTPTKLVLGSVYVGQSARGVVAAVNEGRVPVEADVSLAAPFTLETSHLQLAGDSSMDLVVTFAPLQPGPVSGVLHVGSLEVPVEAVGLDVPACLSTNVCATAHFDFADAQCVQQTRDDGAPCETSCLTGTCSAGVCLGRLKACDDSDACTVDACSQSEGCSHLPLSCPAPTNPCQVARCDSSSGCGTAPALDGTACGPDLCTATLDVCMAGACVTRPRVTLGPCANRWVPISIPARSGHAMAYDAVNQRVVLFGGSRPQGVADTWEWDGSAWVWRTPATSPPARFWHAMASDTARQRIILFGGTPGSSVELSDTWEWDGSTWSAHTPSTSPPKRSGHAMAYDPVRQRVVLFGGSWNRPTFPGVTVLESLADTWEWDGSTWTQRTPVTTPAARSGHAMAYDTVRQRVILFGGTPGSSGDLSDTWEWDGSNWTQLAPVTSPPARHGPAVAYDPVRQRVVLFGGTNRGGDLSDTWEWDGSTWAQRAPVTSPPARGGNPAMAYDTARQRVVLFWGGDWSSLTETWEWDGSSWAQRTAVASPPTRRPMAYDSARQRLVLFGDEGRTSPASTWSWDTGGWSDSFAVTWEWDGTSWTQRTPVNSPSPRSDHAMAYDAARQRVVLFGGSGEVPDTWEWDGTTWTQRTPITSPPGRSAHAMAYDAARQRVVLFGGYGRVGGDSVGRLSDTWEWDGSNWTQRTPLTFPSARCWHAMAYDAARQRVVLVGGWTDYYTSTSPGTWEWDGTTWTQRIPITSPDPTFGHSMAYDSARQRVVLFGNGSSGGGGECYGYLSDTWEWDGTSWAKPSPVTSPPPGCGVIAYDEARQRLTLFNGAGTWVFLP